MHSISHLAPMLSIEYERQEIPVDTLTPSKVPDEKWRHVDSQGHGHFWDGDDLPTLEWVIIGRCLVGDDYDGVEYETGEHRCRLCAEVVEPREKVVYDGPRFIPGLATYTVTIDRERFVLTEDEYAKALTEWADLLRRKS